jgi:hypothetical protein
VDITPQLIEAAPNHRGHSLCWLSFMGNQWIVVHCLDNFRVARKSLFGEVKHMGTQNGLHA